MSMIFIKHVYARARWPRVWGSWGCWWWWSGYDVIQMWTACRLSYPLEGECKVPLRVCLCVRMCVRSASTEYKSTLILHRANHTWQSADLAQLA